MSDGLDHELCLLFLSCKNRTKLKLIFGVITTALPCLSMIEDRSIIWYKQQAFAIACIAGIGDVARGVGGA